MRYLIGVLIHFRLDNETRYMFVKDQGPVQFMMRKGIWNLKRQLLFTVQNIT